MQFLTITIPADKEVCQKIPKSQIDHHYKFIVFFWVKIKHYK